MRGIRTAVVAPGPGALGVVALLVALAGLVVVAERTGPAAPSAAARLPAAPADPVEPASPEPAATVPAAAVSVAPLGTLLEPDAFVTVPGPVTPAGLAAAARVPFVAGLTAVSAGVVHLGALAGDPAVHVLGVDPSGFRAFTPSVTAAADGLWASVARGEVTLDYGLPPPAALLGATTPVLGGSDETLRVGAFAATGLPHAGGLVTREVAASLGFGAPDAVIVSAPQADPAALTARLRGVFGARAGVELLGRFAVDAAVPSTGSTATGSTGAGSTATRPRTYRDLYQEAAATCPGLSWTVLAAIGQVESDHGKNIGPSSAGALGPMQFLPSTWARWGRDADGDGKADILDPVDAVYTAAAYLCSYAPGSGDAALRRAVFAYNHADWYVDEVLALALRYR